MSKIYFWKKQVAKQCTSMLSEKIFLNNEKAFITYLRLCVYVFEYMHIN